MLLIHQVRDKGCPAKFIDVLSNLEPYRGNADLALRLWKIEPVQNLLLRFERYGVKRYFK